MWRMKPSDEPVVVHQTREILYSLVQNTKHDARTRLHTCKIGRRCSTDRKTEHLPRKPMCRARFSGNLYWPVEIYFILDLLSVQKRSDSSCPRFPSRLLRLRYSWQVPQRRWSATLLNCDNGGSDVYMGGHAQHILWLKSIGTSDERKEGELRPRGGCKWITWGILQLKYGRLSWIKMTVTSRTSPNPRSLKISNTYPMNPLKTS